MAKSRIDHVCTARDTAHSKWAGQCSGCGGWNTLAEEVSAARLPTIPAAGPPTPIGSIAADAAAPGAA